MGVMRHRVGSTADRQRPRCLGTVTGSLAGESFQQRLVEGNEAAPPSCAAASTEAAWEKTPKRLFEMLTSERRSWHQRPIRAESWHFLWIIDDLEGRCSFEGPSRWSQALHILCDIKREASSGRMRGWERAKWQPSGINFAAARWRAWKRNTPAQITPSNDHHLPADPPHYNAWGISTKTWQVWLIVLKFRGMCVMDSVPRIRSTIKMSEKFFKKKKKFYLIMLDTNEIIIK